MSEFPPQEQPRPGREGEMTPEPRDEMRGYRGTGKLEGRVALVTGGDSGIGRAVCTAFAKEGAAERGITVNAIAPGEIATPITGAHDRHPTEIERPGIPLRRPGSAHEVAAAIAFLASPEASYVTGESFVVDGGLLLMAAVRAGGGEDEG